nr:MAG TPA: hypothetical protein [Caudoviricetes sp.]
MLKCCAPKPQTRLPSRDYGFFPFPFNLFQPIPSLTSTLRIRGKGNFQGEGELFNNPQAFTS